MNINFMTSVIILVVSISVVTSNKEPPPNIVVIMADDLGWNDVSFHGSGQVLTPNIDTLAVHGVPLEQHYGDAAGSATLSSFYTGKYASKLGTQGNSIEACEDRGLAVTEKLLPAYLQDLGYSTHLVGKWGLGKSRWSYSPTKRGFDSFFGFMGRAVDYYTYNCIEMCNGSQFFGLDFFDDMQPSENNTGYLTKLITERAIETIRQHDSSRPLYLHISHAAPRAGGGLVGLQAPSAAVRDNRHVAHSARRTYAAMVTSLDTSVGETVAALAEKDMLNNTLIIFVSDNGAPIFGDEQNYGTNLPFRGGKGTPYEGGVRSTAIVWHADLRSSIWEGIFHVTDWLPTLVTAAGGKVGDTLDGVNQWDAIKNDGPSNHNNILVTIDDLNGWAAIREGDYKCIIGEVDNNTSGFYGQEIMALRLEAPDYDEALLQCETTRVFDEVFNRTLHIRSALMKRNDSTIVQMEEIDEKLLCVPTAAKGCLFNIREDPLEVHDIWESSHDIVKRLTLRLRSFWAERKPRHRSVGDQRARPQDPDFIWSPWLADDEPIPEALVMPSAFPLQASKGELQYLVDLNFNTFKDQLANYVKSMGDSFVKSASSLMNI